MRTTVVLPLVAAVALLVGGCGEETADEPPAGGSATTTEEEPTATPGDGEDDEDPAASSERFDQRAEEIARDWPDVDRLGSYHEDLLGLEGVAAKPDPDDRTLMVRVGHGACDEDWGAWLEETEELVIVAGWAVEDPEVEACTDELVVDDVDVELSERLGGRTVVDAATGEELVEPDAPKDQERPEDS